MMKRAQVTMEFVTIATFMLVLFAAMFFAVQNRMVAMKDAQNFEVLEQVGNIVKNEVRLAAQVGDGYKRDFTLPTTLNGQDYNVSIQDEIDLVVSYDELEYVAFLEIPVNGDLKKGENVITCCTAGGEATLQG